MKILVTGVTVRSCNVAKQRLRIRWAPCLDEIVKVLREDHDVDWRPVEVGEDLDEYDAVWAATMAPNSLSSLFTPSYLWAVRRGLDRGKNVVIYVDDWATPGIFNGFRSIARHGTPRLLAKYKNGAYINRGDPALTEKYGEQLVSVARDFVNPRSELWDQVIMGLALFKGWGRPHEITRKIDDAPRVQRFDLSPLFLPMFESYQPFEGVKERRWMLAGLSDAHLPWVEKQQLEWPMDQFGPTKNSIRALEDELAVMEEYGKRWGALVPVYPHSGSGWFRPRWLTAAIAGCVTLCDPKDARDLRGPYQITAKEIENMSALELERLNNAQKEHFWGLIEHDREVTKARINAAVEGYTIVDGGHKIIRTPMLVTA